MGRLLYGSQEREIQIDDRSLAHAQLVIIGKLRRSESFTFSWAAAEDTGRATVWIHPSIPIQFQYDGKASVSINQEWLKELTAIASRGDLRLTSEPPGTSS